MSAQNYLKQNLVLLNPNCYIQHIDRETYLSKEKMDTMLVYLCPSDRKYLCSWEGPSAEILEHFTLEHEDLLFYSNNFRIDLKNLSENYLLFFQEEIFLVQHKVTEEILNITLRYLGPVKIASKVTYDLQVHVNTDRLSGDYISIMENGFEINLFQLNKDGVEYLDLTLQVNGDFSISNSSRNSFDGDVFFEEELKDDVYSRVSHIPLKKQKSYDDNKRRSCENINLFFEDDKNESHLCRSRTIGFEEIKKRNVVKRAYSCVSLERIEEDELELNCTNCEETILAPPVFLCSMKHRFCGRCIGSICEVCAEEVMEERDAEFEEKLTKRHHACPNKKNGCTQSFLYKDLPEHETNCQFCNYKCPIAECKFTGHFKDMHKHLRLIHSSVKILETFIVVFQKNSEAFLANAEKGIFYCYYKVQDENVCWFAKFCGPKERRFFCELKFKDGKIKKPILLSKTAENTYSIQMSFQDLKKDKLKSKNAILTIAC